jgi:hypothetical protein
MFGEPSTLSESVWESDLPLASQVVPEMGYRFILIAFIMTLSTCAFAQQEKITIDHSWMAGDTDWRIYPGSWNTNPPMLRASIGHTSLGHAVSLICIDDCGDLSDGHSYQYVKSSSCSGRTIWSLNLAGGWHCVCITGGNRTIGVKEYHYVMHEGPDITNDAKFPVLNVPQNIHGGQFRRW